MSTKTPSSDAAASGKRDVSTGNEGNGGIDIRRFAMRRALERENEHSLIARILHDDIGQTLMAMNLGLYRLSRHCENDPRLQDMIAGLRVLLVDTSRAVRRLAAEFRPGITQSGEPHLLLSTFTERMSAEYGIVCLVSSASRARLPGRTCAIMLHRLLQTALDAVSRQRALTALLLDIQEAERTLVIRISNAMNHDGDDIAPSPQIEELHEWVCVLSGELWLRKERSGSELLRITLPLPE